MQPVLEGSEELREALVALRREVGTLRVEVTHANVLLEALEAMLDVDGDDDPFEGVFKALLPVFECSYAIVLIENIKDPCKLECVASTHAEAVASLWGNSRKLEKVLSGRIVTTISTMDDEAWPQIDGLSKSQPTLYLPLSVRDQRGLMMLMREQEHPGFDTPWL